MLEKDEWFLFHTETAFLVAENDVEGVLAPVGVDVVFFEGGGQDFMAGVFHADAEGFEDFDRRGVAGCVDAGGVVLLRLHGVAERLGGLLGEWLAVAAGGCVVGGRGGVAGVAFAVEQR